MGEKRRSNNNLRRALGWACGAAVALLSAGCVTTDDENANGPTHYTLRRGPTVRHEAPLPQQTDVLVDWHMKNGDRRTVTGFRGWDFDGDGRFELLEVLDPDGAVQARVYDFDGDGAVDLQVK